MKVLVATPLVPWPLFSGSALRTWHLLRAASKGAEIHLRAVAQPDLDEQTARASLSEFCASVELLPRSPAGVTARLSRTRRERTFHSGALEQVLARDLAAGGFDLVHLDDPCLVRALPAAARARGIVHHARLALELARASASGMSDQLDLRNTEQLELFAAENIARHIFGSEPDAARFKARHAHCKTWSIPSGVDLERMQPRDDFPLREPDRFLFVGTLSSPANLDGLRWFQDEILPRARSGYAGAWLDVVGSEGGEAVRELASKELRLSGQLSDLRSAYERCSVAVVPLRIGGGTRIKIVEALALACPLVSTRVGAEGLDLVHAEHLLLADSPDAFAAALLQILNKPEEARAMAKRGQDRVRERYGWDRLGAELVKAWSASLQPAHEG